MTLLVLLYLFDTAQNLNPLYPEGAFFWCMLISVYTLVWCIFKAGATLGTVFTQNQANGRVHIDFSHIGFKAFPKAAKLLIVGPWVLFILLSFYSTILFHWKAYRDQFGQPEAQAFTSDLQTVDLAQIPIVDRSLALKLADKKLGEKPSLGSQVTLGEPTIQMVNGKLIWAVPLHHSGFFKWITNLSGSAGYITVSATDFNDTDYIGEHKIKYQPRSYLLHDLGRYTRFRKALFTGIADYAFELDDNGVPYWIVTTYKNLRGFALPEATGIITVNAETGASQRYALADVPSWVDRVQPEYFIINQINNQGRYVHGFLNFSDRDKFQSSEGQAIVYNNNRCYLFTGLTSVGNDESSIGFVMVDMVTKQPLLYQMSGATEYAAQGSAQGKVQHLGYQASFPLIINADGAPTYFMTLKDREGLIKLYAMVSVQNYSVVGVGETVRESYESYRKAMQQSGTGSGFLPPTQQQFGEISGRVLRIASQFVDDQTVYYLILEEQPDKIFTVHVGLGPELPLTQEGDAVRIGYYGELAGQPVVEAREFDNLLFSQS